MRKPRYPYFWTPAVAQTGQWRDQHWRTLGSMSWTVPRCGGRLRLVALIEQASMIQRILRHLGLPTDVPEPRPARSPPLDLDPTEDQLREAPDVDATW